MVVTICLRRFEAGVNTSPHISHMKYLLSFVSFEWRVTQCSNIRSPFQIFDHLTSKSSFILFANCIRNFCFPTNSPSSSSACTSSALSSSSTLSGRPRWLHLHPLSAAESLFGRLDLNNFVQKVKANFHFPQFKIQNAFLQYEVTMWTFKLFRHENIFAQHLSALSP